VLIVADDMRPDGLWVMPTLTRLAERGVTFPNAFATTPVCCPSRASILTGRYARHHGVLTNLPPNGGVGAFDDRSTLATWLQAAGVRTALVGRYLNGYHEQRIPPGWDYWFGIWTYGEDNGLYYRYYATNPNGRDEFFGSSSEDHSTRVVTRRALSFLRGEPGRPFMLMLAPRAPHSPATPDVHDRGLFRGAELPLPPSYNEPDVSDKPAEIRDRAPLNAEQLVRIEDVRRRQLETLVGLDRMIGALVGQLEADGRLAQTWFIFTADNGFLLGEHRLPAGKGCAYEECARVPFIVVPPTGIAGPRSDDRLVANIDLAPTIAAIQGTEPERPVDGRSLLPLLDGSVADWRDALILEGWSTRDGDDFFQALRTADRKYVRHPTGETELYDLAADPYELDNLAGRAEQAAEVARLAARLDEALAR
jgi:N-acetylglucosamine-6-sulfatase